MGLKWRPRCCNKDVQASAKEGKCMTLWLPLVSNGHPTRPTDSTGSGPSRGSAPGREPIVVMSTPQFVSCAVAVVAAGRLPFIWQKQQLNVFAMAIIIIMAAIAAIFLVDNLLCFWAAAGTEAALEIIAV